MTPTKKTPPDPYSDEAINAMFENLFARAAAELDAPGPKLHDVENGEYVEDVVEDWGSAPGVPEEE